MHETPMYDVIISGAGPVGLFLGCELALAKCSVLILERSSDIQSPIKQLPFGIRGLSAPTIEALYRRGLLDELQIHKHLKNPHQHIKSGAQRQVGHFAGIPFLEVNIDTSRWTNRLPSSTPTSLISEMQEMETVLSRRAEALGVAILRGHALTGFSQNADTVTITAQTSTTQAHADSTQADAGATPGVVGASTVLTFQARWLVGCDGARSVVRKLSNIGFAGTEPEFTGYSAKMDVLDPEKLKPGRNVTATGMYLQSQPGYFNLQDFDAGAFHGSGEPITLEHIQEVLRRVSGTDVTVTALHIAASWTDRARQAIEYRKGRVFLAGDAAHIHAPLGGQGLNLGLGDAMNLGWKLAAAIHGKAPEDLLDTYFTERHPIGAQVLDWSRAQAAIMGTTPEARALYAIMKDLINTRDGATYMAARVWGVNTKYDLGGEQPADGAASSERADSGSDFIGTSVPNFELGDGTTIGELMRDGQAIMLDFQADSALKSLAEDYGIRYVSGTTAHSLGLSAALVRPDGYIAWAAADTAATNERPEGLEQPGTADRVAEARPIVEHWFLKH